MLAAQRGQRPEKLKQEMAKDGTLANLYVQMREQKAVDKILEGREIEEVDVQADEEGKKTREHYRATSRRHQARDGTSERRIST